MIRAEPADRRIGREPGSLTLIVDLHAGGLAQQIVGVERGRLLHDGRENPDRPGGVFAPRRRCGHRHGLKRDRPAGEGIPMLMQRVGRRRLLTNEAQRRRQDGERQQLVTHGVLRSLSMDEGGPSSGCH